METAIKFEDVSVIFGRKTDAALQFANQGEGRETIQEKTGNILGVSKCSLNIDVGEIVVLMGLSGSGKSTLLRTVNGLNPITAGSVSVRNGSEMVNIGTADKNTLLQLRTQAVAMVFQNFALLPWRTVTENVGLGLELSGISKTEREERVAKQLELVGLQDWGDRTITELSGGMRQRVGLARAFVTDAPILLMDEPFSALDPLIRAHLQDELLELQEKTKRTILFVSHDLDEAMKIGNKIAIMKGGRINQFGTPQEIVLNPSDSYVKEFVAHMNPLNVLCAGDIMSESSDGSASRTISEETPLRDLVHMMWENSENLDVTSEGAIIGSVTSKDIFKSLSGL
ncbi:choline ABC transporter ATP-binding protein [Alphaproteobacteria bacterium 46_93_T64]|nr:choline ABC transporter ATP-binding protein [Alphaproteobacteria bacterium 46_93_T64]